MEHLPEWLGNLLYAALGGVGVLGMGLIRARVDNNRTRTEDRTAFTGQLLERVTALESSLADERRYCEDRMVHLEQVYEKRLDSRDRVITELRDRVAHLETLMSGATE